MSRRIGTSATQTPSAGALGPDEILDFWLGPLDVHGLASAERAARWWQKHSEFDDEIRRRFGFAHEAVATGLRAEWLGTPRGRLAWVIVLDQFSRNLFRDTARMFAWDALALDQARRALADREERQLATDERAFLFMPLMHSESLADQQRCVTLFESLASGLAGEARARIETNAEFARRHRDIVARFGRFPHRNTLLGRVSTTEEIDFLKQPGSSF